MERYAELLRVHVLPTLGGRSLQQIQSTEIDGLYARLGQRVSARTAHHVHSVLGACLGAAVRTRKLPRNPMLELTKIPSLARPTTEWLLMKSNCLPLCEGLRVRHSTNCRGGSVYGCEAEQNVALTWIDLDPAQKALRIERALEETDAHGVLIKEPKTERGKRTITIDDDLLGLLFAQRERHLRLAAGVPDGGKVDLSLVKLPDGALIFPDPPAPARSYR